MAKVSLENFQQEIQKILDEYGDDIQKNLDEVVDKAGKKAAQLLRNTSPVDPNGKKPGAYAKGWTVEKSAKHTGRLDGTYAVVYNKHPGLPHLLENGHALRQGGRWEPKAAHIEPVETAVFDSLNLEDIAK